MLALSKQRVKLSFIFLCLGGVLLSCASYQTAVSQSRQMLESGEYVQALSVLKPLAEEEDKDQLVYLLDYATALQVAGDYQESSKMFIKAHELAEQKDYHSLSKIAGSLVLSEEMVQYKGDDFEKLFINVMSAINFLMLGNNELANVETKRINEKLEYFRIEEKKRYEQNHFAQYLSAMIWEDSKNWDNAYIFYKKVYDANPSFNYIKEDLVRLSELSRRSGEHRKWKNRFGKQSKLSKANYNSMGELILIYQQGWGPRKIPNPGFIQLPTLIGKRSEARRAKLIIEGVSEELTQEIYDVEKVAILSHRDQFAGLLAKRIAAEAAKRAASRMVSKEDNLLGGLMYMGLKIADRADLRQWSTLPETMQVARVPLKPGKYKVRIMGLAAGGRETSQQKESFEVEIKKSKKTFINWRSF